jgi:hypothetical protein
MRNVVTNVLVQIFTRIPYVKSNADSHIPSVTYNQYVGQEKVDLYIHCLIPLHGVVLN